MHINTLHFTGHFSRWTWVSCYQNVSILDFIGDKDDGGGDDNWSYKTCKASVKLLPSTNQHPVFTGRMPFCPTNSVRALKDKVSHSIYGCDHPKLTWGLPTLSLTIKGSSYYGKCCQASCQPCDASTPALCQCGLSY